MKLNYCFFLLVLSPFGGLLFADHDQQKAIDATSARIKDEHDCVVITYLQKELSKHPECLELMNTQDF